MAIRPCRWEITAKSLSWNSELRCLLVAVGIFLAAASALVLVVLTLRAPARARYPLHGWLGFVLLAVCETLLFLHVGWVRTFFTALAWTAYILIVDAALFRLRGHSWLNRPLMLLAVALLSIPGWIVFELYNFRLHNWIYTGVPGSMAVLCVGAAWAFATIYPGIFLTAELFEVTWTHAWRCRPRPWRPSTLKVLLAVGAICLVLPLIAPADWAPYMFAPVWAGFIFFLDPINYRRGWPSLLADFERGRPGRFAALLLSGAVCGFFWEFWNYWAAARWQYVFPILHHLRIFAMPIPGFIGFPPFAIECFTMAVFLAHTLLPPRLRPPFESPGV